MDTTQLCTVIHTALKLMLFFSKSRHLLVCTSSLFQAYESCQIHVKMGTSLSFFIQLPTLDNYLINSCIIPVSLGIILLQ